MCSTIDRLRVWAIGRRVIASLEKKQNKNPLFFVLSSNGTVKNLIETSLRGESIFQNFVLEER